MHRIEQTRSTATANSSVKSGGRRKDRWVWQGGIMVIILLQCFSATDLSSTLSSGSNKSSLLRQKESWLWHHYSDPQHPRIIIAQSIGMDPGYGKMLQITNAVNKAYARKHHYDYVLFRGVALGGCKDWHATFNKVEVLHVALDQNVYDAALILDVDALVVDFDTDVMSLVDEKYALVAQRVSIEPHAWNLNIGVALWNLRHNQTAWIAQRWRTMSIQTLASYRPKDDQVVLQHILRDEMSEVDRNTSIHTVGDIFAYRSGTFVKHFIRGNSIWNDDHLQDRLSRLEQSANETCRKFAPSCEGIA